MIALEQMTRALLVVIVMFGLTPQPALANASCTFSITDVDFGNIDVTLGTAFTTTGTVSATCTGGGANEDLTICVHFREGSGGSSGGGSRRKMENGGDDMEFNLYKRASYTQFWGAIDWKFQPLRWRVILNSSGNFNGTQTIYGKVNPNQTTLPTGVYTDNFTGSEQAKIEYKQGNINCRRIWNSADGTEYESFIATANNIGTCTVLATNIDFGSIGVLTSNIDATSSVDVTCANGLPYDVGLDGGLSGATDPTNRNMTLSSEQVRYGLYRDLARTQPWGDTIGTDTAAGTGSGSSQAFTVYGRVPSQTTPAPGTYTDTIIVTVTF